MLDINFSKRFVSIFCIKFMKNEHNLSSNCREIHYWGPYFTLRSSSYAWLRSRITSCFAGSTLYWSNSCLQISFLFFVRKKWKIKDALLDFWKTNDLGSSSKSQRVSKQILVLDSSRIFQDPRISKKKQISEFFSRMIFKPCNKFSIGALPLKKSKGSPSSQ